MFTVKATYRTETRKFTFSDTSSFPSYDDLYLQLYRVFPISHNYYLSKLLFSPDAGKPARVLLRREVHNAEEYETAISAFDGRRWPNALLKFSIFDETPHKVPRPPIQTSTSTKDQLGEDEKAIMTEAKRERRRQQAILADTIKSMDRAKQSAFREVGHAGPEQMDPWVTPRGFPDTRLRFSSVQNNEDDARSRAKDDGLRPPVLSQRMADVHDRLHKLVGSPRDGPSHEGSENQVRPVRWSKALPRAPVHPAPPKGRFIPCEVPEDGNLFNRRGDRSAEDLNSRFARIMDESVRTLHSASDSHGKQYSPLPPLFQPSSTASRNRTAHLPPPPQPLFVHKPPSPSFVPPPPVIFSSPSNEAIPTQRTPQSACCAADVQQLMETFKTDLERIVQARLPCPVHTGVCEPPAPQEQPNADAPMEGVANVPVQLTCTTCGNDFTGPEYTTCNVCLWKVICGGCANDLALARHVDLHDDSHSFIKKGGDAAVPQPADSAANAPLEEPQPRLAVHTGVVCDVCGQVPVGVRHKCLDCPDFDLCDTCLHDGAAERHNPFHEFFGISEPGRVVVHTVFSGNGERTPTPVAAAQRATPVEPTPVPAPAPAPVAAEVVTHNATCDLCDSKIRGDRYKCLNCPDFDTCKACFAITAEQHPNHGFVKVSTPEELILRNALAIGSRHYATCDGCKKVIKGVRYKCMHATCPDFDLCANCEALPIPVHPATHPMLKVKTPDTLIPSVYRAPTGVASVAEPVPAHQPSETAPTEAPAVAPAAAPSSAAAAPVDGPRSAAEQTDALQNFFQSLLSTRRHEPTSPSFAPGYQPVYIRPASPTGTDLTYRDPEEVEQMESRPLTPLAEPMEPTRMQVPLVEPMQVDNAPTVEKQEAPVETKETETLSPPSMESSAAGFTLPPLGLDPNGDVFRDLWPRVAQELRNLMSGTGLTSAASAEETSQPTEKAAANMQQPSTAETSAPPMQEVQEVTPVTTFTKALSGLMSGQVSSVVSPSPLTTSVASLNNHVEGNDIQVQAAAPQTISYPDILQASFVADATVPDGQVFPPGAEFVKAWRMQNAGRDWPETTELVFVAGEKFGTKQHFLVGPLASGQEMDVWTGELKAPEVPGRYVGYWRLADGQGLLFGHSLWIDITVVEASHHSDGSSDGHSLSSSAVIMPVAASVRSAEGDTNGPASPAVTAPVAPSTPLHVAVEVASDAGSDNSSISLISVPSSDDDDDVAVWEDSRSQVQSSPRVPQRNALDYVVLYDESSSEEE